MGPWVHTCERCCGNSTFQVSDMLLPQLACSHCGQVVIKSPEAIAHTRAMLDEHNWYAGFLQLILGLERELDIEFTDDDFPKTFVTWGQLLALTKERCGAAVAEDDIVAAMGRLSSRSTNVIRNEINEVKNQ